MIESLQASLQSRCVEVHQKADWKSCQLQISDHLCGVDRVETVDSSEFNDDATTDEQIYFESRLEPVTLEVERNEFLDLDLNAIAFQNDDQALLINGLQQAGPKFSMDFDTAADHRVRQHFDLRVAFLHARWQGHKSRQRYLLEFLIDKGQLVAVIANQKPFDLRTS